MVLKATVQLCCQVGRQAVAATNALEGAGGLQLSSVPWKAHWLSGERRMHRSVAQESIAARRCARAGACRRGTDLKWRVRLRSRLGGSRVRLAGDVCVQCGALL